MINVIGGKFKRINLDVPNLDVRPTSSRIREAIFSILESYALQNSINLYQNKCCIDLFAGSGALGLEAISRGISFSYFFENNNETFNTLLNNCNKICKNKEFIIYNEDNNLLNKENIKFPTSIIFIDPPYELNLIDSILKKILDNDILNDSSLIVIESDKNTFINYSKYFKLIKEKTYGKTKIIFLKKLI